MSTRQEYAKEMKNIRMSVPQCRQSYEQRHAQDVLVCSQSHGERQIVPLRVWVLASAACLAVCAALVLAAAALTRWGSVPDYRPYRQPEFPLSMPKHNEHRSPDRSAILKTLKSFMNREKVDTLAQQPQYLPELEIIKHDEKIIEKKDKATNHTFDRSHKTIDRKENREYKIEQKRIEVIEEIPEFKPTLPDLESLRLPKGYIDNIDKHNNDYYNIDSYFSDNYEDYSESDGIMNYLTDKIHELYSWIKSDPDFQVLKNSTKKPDLEELLTALNESISEGNVTIIMLKLKDLYMGGREHISTTRMSLNNSELLTFGILTLDVILLHNIQLLAWENLDPMSLQVLNEKEVYAMNALFLPPEQVTESGGDQDVFGRRSSTEDPSLLRGLLDSALEMGLATARAALHIGRAYKHAKSSLKLAKPETSIPSALTRHSAANTRAVLHLERELRVDERDLRVDVSARVLDCVWTLYCRNLALTAKLPAPYGAMARINGIGLRLMTGDIASEKALDVLITESISGWTHLACDKILPRCNAPGQAVDVVLESIKRQNKL